MAGHRMRRAAAGIPAEPIVWTETDNASDNAQRSTYTFNNLSIGAADSSRWIAALVSGYDGSFNRQVSEIAIDGVAMSLENHLVRKGNAGIGWKAVPSGTTANFTVDFYNSGAQTVDACRITIVSMTCANGSIYNADSNSTRNSLTDLDSARILTVPAGGIGLLAVGFLMTSAGGGFTYTNCSELWSQNGQDGGSFDFAHAINDTESGTVEMIATLTSGTPDERTIIGASFGVTV